ncbi:MAG: UDP-N-acetylmuramoyl-L-alanine--D-glutamate ligase [Candidatus Levybacteria bacterium]|nr:UDP-N-acetylmuramoyl-L-alanine--D-glutamate ligase [Candidatus Levybacteria bacterium]
MKIEDLKNKKILIVGKGVEGTAVFDLLKKHLPKNQIVIVDQKDGANYLDKQKEFDIAIKSPGVKAEVLKIPYTTATNIFLSNAKGKIIGVTGSKGKSTTSTLIYKMFEKSFGSAQDKQDNVYFGGNIGQSPLEFLDKLNDQSWTVFEMSSFQLKDAKISPHIAVMLMVTAEHLDYHKDEKDYADSKRNILRFQKESDFAIINIDYIASHESDIYTQGKVYWVSRERECERGCYVKDGKIILKISTDQSDGNERFTHAAKAARKTSSESQLNTRSLSENRLRNNSYLEENPGSVFSSFAGGKSSIAKGKVVIDIKNILLPGEHNLENVCAAIMAASLAGVSKENIVKVLKTFKGLEHRLEFVGEKDGIKFYNDSLATIPKAVIEALKTLKETETLIAGGYDRGADFSILGEVIVKSNIKTLVLFLPTGKKIRDAVEKAGKNDIEKFDVTSMEQAVRIAFAETSHGKICLLSPASASFGLFKDYKDRGEQFKKEVKNLQK